MRTSCNLKYTQILQDTSKKINHFRELLEKKKNDGKVEEAIKVRCRFSSDL